MVCRNDTTSHTPTVLSYTISLPPMWIFQVQGSQKEPFVPKHTVLGYRLEQKQKQTKKKKRYKWLNGNHFLLLNNSKAGHPSELEPNGFCEWNIQE